MEEPSILQNPEELEANRQGRITPAQIERLRPQARGLGSSCLGIFLTILGTGLACVLATIAAALLDADAEPTVAAWCLVGLAGTSSLAWVLFRAWQKQHVFNRECDTSTIEQGTGELIFQKNEYKLVVNDRVLTIHFSENACGLLPGVPYQVYYLPESRLVLSVEPAQNIATNQVQEAVNQILIKAHRFTPEELEANRMGQITTSQRLKPLPTAIGGFLLSLTIFIGLIIDLATGLTLSSQIFPLIIAVLGFYYGSTRFGNALTDMLQSAPSELSGIAFKTLRVGGRRNREAFYFYRFDSGELQVSHKAYDLLLPNLEYRVFYLPKTGRILSMELTGLAQQS